jgi:hypothetical protein
MIDVAQLVEFELLSAGGRLWKSVECDGTRGRWVVYANLRASESDGTCEPDAASEPIPHPAFAESAEILKRVLDNRLNARDWIAAVLCGERLSYTIRPD